ncbi:MAG: glycoside hydrolase family 32 protein [Armatimonadota bacterium]
MELTLEKRYLNFPVKRGAGMRKVSVAIADGPRREFDIELAEGDADYWVFMNVAEFVGRRVVISAEADVRNEAAIVGAEDLYREQYRPQAHFTSRRGWLNDPNGLVYYAGEYHLFYQHNPYGWGWGNMHWGHAVSSDLTHWEELPEALYPDELGTCFSGSAVVDWEDTAGFQTGAEKTLVAIYTAAGEPFTQCLAYSNDRGRTWEKYEGNPVLGHIAGSNRDPKVIWYEPERKWLMALYLDGEDFALFASPDLKVWEKLCDVKVPGCSECPEFFPMALDGNEGRQRWVFYGGDGSYLIGDFDGKSFAAESGPHRMHFGNAFYASQTFNEEPEGRRVVIGWARGVELPGMAFNQMMNFPCEFTLRTTAEGPRLFVQPVGEVSGLYGQRVPVSEAGVVDGIRGDVCDIEVEFELRGATEAGIFVRGIPVRYQAGAKVLSCLGCTAALELREGKVKLRAIVDRTSIEIFANDGEVFMPVGVIPANGVHGVEVFVRGGEARVAGESRELRSGWER